MTGRYAKVMLALLMATYASCSAAVTMCKAQAPDIVWSEPLNLSSSSGNSVHPAIVADAYGDVHVFWSEHISDQGNVSGQRLDPPNAIVYRRWDGTDWSEPCDVLAVKDDPLADYVAVAVDSQDQLHVVWTGQSQLYYSSAPFAEASTARGWSLPTVIAPQNARTVYESDIAIDSHDVVHVVYAAGGDGRAVLHTMLVPGNAAWTMPVRISGYLRDNETAYADVRLVIDELDRLHAVWSTSNPQGYGQAVYYARSEQAGQVWDAPVMLADATIDTGFTGFPSLLSLGEGEMVLLHVDQSNDGRIQRTSTDAGRTWSAARLVLASMEGVNGFLIPLVDNGGGQHLIVNMRPLADQRVGIYYAPRAGLDWAPIMPVATDESYSSAAHYTDATMRLGSEIHVVWTQLQTGEIWYVRGEIHGVPSIPPKETPLATSAANTSGVRDNTVNAPTPESGSAPTEVPSGSTVASDPAESPWTPIVAAAVPVIALVAVIIGWRLRRR